MSGGAPAGATTPSARVGAPPSPPPLAARLADFFRVFAPAKAEHAPDVAAAYAGREAALLAFLERRYLAPGFFSWPATDCRSAYFDALAALYADDVVPPVLLARPLDTVHKAQVLLPGGPEGTVRLGVGDGGGDARARQRT